VYPCKTWSE